MVEPLTQMPKAPETKAESNPLKKYYRQPAIYIKLPSGGQFYNSDSFTKTETGELGVFPMTAKDEMAFKTPDGLINGQSTVDVIESCIPNIKNAWKVVNHDVDVILLAIRIATYGETMDVTGTVPGTSESVTHTVNLPAMLEQVNQVKIVDNFITESGFQIKVRPMDYKTITETQQSAFEQQKQYAALATRTDLDDRAKGEQFSKNFKKLTEMNFDVLRRSIMQIRTPDGVEVNDQSQIADFLNNVDRKIVTEIQKGLTDNRNQAALPPVKMKATEEQIKKGAPANYDMPLTFDAANFFV
jgi:hypothetical protein